MIPRYEIGRGGEEDESGLILVIDHEAGIIVARSSQMALKHVQELVQLANRPAVTTTTEPRAGIVLGRFVAVLSALDEFYSLKDAILWCESPPVTSGRQASAGVAFDR
jgi:hypothetical protein